LDPSTLEDEGTALLGNAAKHPASAAASIPETRILFSVYFAHDGTLLARTYWLSVSKTPVPQASQRLITIHLLMQRCKVQWWSTGTGRGGGGSISFLSRKKNSCESYISNRQFCSVGGRFGCGIYRALLSRISGTFFWIRGFSVIWSTMDKTY